MANKIIIAIGLILLFIGLFNLSIFVFNFFNVWLGIAIDWKEILKAYRTQNTKELVTSKEINWE